MRLIWKAIRAVTVETLGVVAVVWMLFTAAGWTMQTADAGSERGASQRAGWFASPSWDLTGPLLPAVREEDRSRYVEQRLDHYSRLYQERARHYLLPAT